MELDSVPRKRPRLEEPVTSAPPSFAASTLHTASYMRTTDFALQSTPANARSTSLYASSANLMNPYAETPKCTVASHQRLEGVVKQLDVLRKMDNEAHELVKTELQEQIERLEASMQVLARKLQVALSEKDRAAEEASAAALQAQSVIALQAKITEQEAALKTAQSEAAIARREAAMLRERVRDFEASQHSSEKRCEDAMQSMRMELQRTQQHAYQPQRTDASSSGDADVAAIAAKYDRQLQGLRDTLAKAEREKTQAQNDAKNAVQALRNIELMQERVYVAESKVQRLEKQSNKVKVLESRLLSAVQVIDLYGRYMVDASKIDSQTGISAASGDSIRLTDIVQRDIQYSDASNQSQHATAGSTSDASLHCPYQYTMEALNEQQVKASSLITSLHHVRNTLATQSQLLTDVRQKLSLLHQSRQALAQRNTELSDSLHMLSIKKLAVEASEAKEKRRCALHEQQIQNYKSIIATYQAEEKANDGTATDSTNMTSIPQGQTQAFVSSISVGGIGSRAPPTDLHKRMNALEAQLTGAVDLLKDAYGQMEAMHTPQQAEVLAARVKSLSSEVELLKHENDVLYSYTRTTTPEAASASDGTGYGASTDDVYRYLPWLRKAEADLCKAAVDTDTAMTEAKERANAGIDTQAMALDARRKQTAATNSAGTDASGAPSNETTVGQAQERQNDADKYFIGLACLHRPTKVIHLSLNPASKTLKECFTKQDGAIATLKSEVTVLRAQLQSLAASRSTTIMVNNTALTQPVAGAQALVKATEPASSSPQAGQNTPNTVTLESYLDVVGMNTTIAGPSSSATSQQLEFERYRQRLTKLYKQQVNAFKDAVYRLTGYEIALFPSTTSPGHAELTVKSTYFEDEKDYLKFLVRGEEVDMVATPYVERLDARFKTYLDMFRSIPAFLAALTLDALEKTTTS